MYLWDKQPGEPDGAFAHFLIYLGLGPTRTVTGAIREGAKTSEEKRSWTRGKGGQARSPRSGESGRNGTWEKESRLYSWEKRATAYDVSLLTQAVQNTATLTLLGMNLYVRKYVELASRPGMTAPRFRVLTEGVMTLGQIITPQTISALAVAAPADDQPESCHDAGAGTSTGTSATKPAAAAK